MLRRFVIKSLIFICPLLLFFVAAEVFARSIPNTYSYKTEWMYNYRDSIRCLVLGNSHMYAGIDPSVIEGCFSLAHPGQKLEYDYFLISKYIDNCANLHSVILLLDYYNLFDSPYETEGRSDWNRAIYYNLYMGYPKHSSLSKYHYESSCSIYMCSKIEHYLKSILMTGTYELNCDSLGKGVKYQYTNRSLRELNPQYLYIKELKSSRAFGINMMSQNLDYLRKSIELCKSHGVRAILISPPYWHYFNDILDNKRLNLLSSVVDSLKRDYDVEYMDYRSDTRFSKTPQFFNDAHHLSEGGAILFTKILKHDFEL